MPERDFSIQRMGNWRDNFGGEGVEKVPLGKLSLIKDGQSNRLYVLAQRGDREVDRGQWSMRASWGVKYRKEK